MSPPHLAQSRVKTIIKSSSDVEVVSKESTYLITRAAELFIKQLANQAYKETNRAKLEYKNIANVVNIDSRYEFLREIIPKKITVREYLKLMKEKGVDIGSDYSVSSSSSSSEESSSEEEEKEKQEEKEKKNTDISKTKEDRGSPDSDVIILD